MENMKDDLEYIGLGYNGGYTFGQGVRWIIECVGHGFVVKDLDKCNIPLGCDIGFFGRIGTKTGGGRKWGECELMLKSPVLPEHAITYLWGHEDDDTNRILKNSLNLVGVGGTIKTKDLRNSVSSTGNNERVRVYVEDKSNYLTLTQIFSYVRTFIAGPKDSIFLVWNACRDIVSRENLLGFIDGNQDSKVGEVRLSDRVRSNSI